MIDPAVELNAWRAPSVRQESLRHEFVQHTNSREHPASRESRPDHLTASALVLSTEGARVLLGLHRKVGLWLQFGGHVEEVDETLAAAGLREAREESGIDSLVLHTRAPVQLDRHAAPCAVNARHHLDVQFLALTPADAVPVVSAESIDVRWFDVDDLPADTDEAVRALVAASLQRLRSSDG